MKTKNFPNLAPVPLQFIRSDAIIVQSAGFVVFGSRKWEPFRRVAQLRGSAPMLSTVELSL